MPAGVGNGKAGPDPDVGQFCWERPSHRKACHGSGRALIILTERPMAFAWTTTRRREPCDRDGPQGGLACIFLEKAARSADHIGRYSQFYFDENRISRYSKEYYPPRGDDFTRFVKLGRV